jgi:hypothetical protein
VAIDILGDSEDDGALSIIELKKLDSSSTREILTELIAYRSVLLQQAHFRGACHRIILMVAVCEMGADYGIVSNALADMLCRSSDCFLILIPKLKDSRPLSAANFFLEPVIPDQDAIRKFLGIMFHVDYFSGREYHLGTHEDGGRPSEDIQRLIPHICQQLGSDGFSGFCLFEPFSSGKTGNLIVMLYSATPGTADGCKIIPAVNYHSDLSYSPAFDAWTIHQKCINCLSTVFRLAGHVYDSYGVEWHQKRNDVFSDFYGAFGFVDKLFVVYARAKAAINSGSKMPLDYMNADSFKQFLDLMSASALPDPELLAGLSSTDEPSLLAELSVAGAGVDDDG